MPYQFKPDVHLRRYSFGGGVFVVDHATRRIIGEIKRTNYGWEAYSWLSTRRFAGPSRRAAIKQMIIHDMKSGDYRELCIGRRRADAQDTA